MWINSVVLKSFFLFYVADSGLPLWLYMLVYLVIVGVLCLICGELLVVLFSDAMVLVLLNDCRFIYCCARFAD